MRSISFTVSAIRDLEALTRRERFAVVNAIEGLPCHPCLYEVWVGARARLMGCGSQRVVYELTPDTADNQAAGDITILRILGPEMP